MKLLEVRLEQAVETGEGHVTITLNTGHQPEMVAQVAAAAMELHWHVKAVWKGEANVTYILLRYEAP